MMRIFLHNSAQCLSLGMKKFRFKVAEDANPFLVAKSYYADWIGSQAFSSHFFISTAATYYGSTFLFY